MTIREVAEKYGVCLGGGYAQWVGGPFYACGIHMTDHQKGVIDPFGVAHYTNRRFTRRSLRNLLMLVARRDREADPNYLNLPQYEFFYLWKDNVTASKMALDLGYRLPARLSRKDRLRCLQLVRRHKVNLSRRPALYAWATNG